VHQKAEMRDGVHDILMNMVRPNLFDNLLRQWPKFQRDYID